MNKNYIDRFMKNLNDNLKNNQAYFEANFDGNQTVNIHNYDIVPYKEKAQSFLESTPEISDMDIYPKGALFDLNFIHWPNGEIELAIKKIKKIKFERFYKPVVFHHKCKKISFHPDKGEVYLYDNSKKKGYARMLTYKDLTQQLLSFIDDPVFYQVIYSYLQTIAMDENKCFLSDIKKELFDRSLIIPAKVSGLCNKLYPNKRSFLEIEYKYKPINRANKEPLSKSVFIKKAQAYLSENQLQKFWNINIENINFYDVDYRRGRDIAKILYTELILSNIKCHDKSFPKDDYLEIKMLIEDYFNSSFTLGLDDELSYNISSIKALNKKHGHQTRLLAELDFKKHKSKYNLKIKELKNSPFKKLKLPDKYKQIESAEELYLEGAIQHNCVFSYLDKINNGKCVIYTCIYKEKKYTIEISYEKNKFKLAQLRGPFNSNPPEELINEILNDLDEENKRLFKNK